jgi:hypothetical protein
MLPSPRQRALALRALHAHGQKHCVWVKLYGEREDKQVVKVKMQSGMVYFQPVGYSGWIGAQHLEEISILEVQ